MYLWVFKWLKKEGSEQVCKTQVVAIVSEAMHS